FEAVMPPNIKVLAKGGSAVPKFIRLCIATSSKVLAGRRDDLVKFIAAEMDAYKFAATHRDETIKVAHELTNAKSDDKRAEFISDQAIRDKQIDPTLAIPADRIEWMQELFVKAGVIPKAVPTASGRGKRACAVFMRASVRMITAGNGATFFVVMSTCSVIFSDVGNPALG